MNSSPIFLGADIGTQGIRVVAIDQSGNLVGSREETFELDERARQEQSPEKWWDVLLRVMGDLAHQLRSVGKLDAIQALSVTSTSGTMIPLDSNNQPLHGAIMYSDKRSSTEAEVCREAASQDNGEGYKDFNSSSGLPKILWFINNYPEKYEKIDRWAHATDFITGKLSGVWGVTDYTNALKTGYDLTNLCWPDYLFQKLSLPRSWFPNVYPSGTPIGRILPEVAEITGLPKTIMIVAGMTDGCASQIASGAIHLGDWNTTIGTTLVIKGVTKNKVVDPLGRIYNHRHPEGFWMPGGASNTGADWVTKEFGNADLEALNKQADGIIPTSFMAYPLHQEGERFPFIAPQARGFEPQGLSKEEAFAAKMEGVAYLERYAYEIMEGLSGEQVRAVFTAGGASNSDIWLTIRSSVLNKPIYKMRHTMGAVGAAILAASQNYFSSISEAGKALTVCEKQVEPSKQLISQYDENYHRFIEILQDKGYLSKEGNVVG
ncbi:FGGY-family carbohydrate kinase [Polycladomyces subterraneus]|uniref:FGGY-family carbohydrate kinase n=1 Tax=Polycladomyces subterraneus TaxID=1016997 RepID=A0ABT8IMC5_9BACL|nr:FGGY-family carbohydrate kinase [Polycladomyces subterraneus]MDN4593875.1 FGGY-family carbohydrate kinase [Polycladomyces subterraneus]